MKQKHIVIFLLVISFFTSLGAMADSCTADVESTGFKLVGKRMVTTWKVQHDLGKDKLARVRFEYTVRYTVANDKRNKIHSMRSSFSELIRGQGKQYTKENLPSLSFEEPTEIVSVDFDHIGCRD